MTQTLTTERLKELADPNMICKCGWDEYKSMARELLASREAQPVAPVLSVQFKDGWPVDGTTGIYSGSPVIPDGFHDFYIAQPAPEVPDKIAPTYEAIKAILPTANPDEYACCVGADMWNACRAAMLVKAPTAHNGWIACSKRMPEEEDVVLVCQEGGVIYCAEMENGVLYPDEFPRVPSAGREITHWMPLPAAPEGGE
jgi:hypothetical protein